MIYEETFDALMYLMSISASNDDFLLHTGVAHDENPPGRGSGRFAFGSGDRPFQHDYTLAKQVHDLKAQGLSMTDIAKGLGYTGRKGDGSVEKLRAALSMENDARKASLAATVPKYRERGMSIHAIAEKLGVSDTTVRNYLDAERKVEFSKTKTVADAIKMELKDKHCIDVGPGVELDMGVSREKLKTALASLESEGYKVHIVKVEQLGNPGKYTTITAIGEPETEWKDYVKDPAKIKSFQSYIVNNGESVQGLQPVESIDSKRVKIVYAEEGGEDRDGLIQLKRGVEDISLGNSQYAQVRIGVDGTHYMKGMAVYADDDQFPPGVDVLYNSNKHLGMDKYDVFKKMKTLKDESGKDTGIVDPDNPFGATIKPLTAGGQSYCLDQNGKPTDKLRVINKVNDQGDWGEWGKTISPQVLSKQRPELAKSQLDLTYAEKRLEFEEINALTNPTIKKKLLESFADDCDAAASHLKAKAFTGQMTHAIIPIKSMGDSECYAPNYSDGTVLALIRYPHAGPFEMPILRVNNSNKEANGCMHNAPDAIGINKNVADRLSGADFDGDTVVAVPVATSGLRNKSPLKGLEHFNTKTYKFEDPDAKGITSSGKQREMGIATNLIADMQIRGCSEEDLADAVRYSMVVIDSEKHHLDYKKAYRDFHIKSLKDKYQDGGGASTLITRAKSEYDRPKTKLGSMVDEEGNKHYGIDPATGKKILVPTGETYSKAAPTKADPYRRKVVERLEKITKMDAVDDAMELLSSKDNPNPIEIVYGTYANQMKALANEARKAYVSTPRLQRNAEAAKEYSEEVESLTSKLRVAEKNQPRERQAQAIANSEYKAKLKQHPELKEDKDQMKRLKNQCLAAARRRVGAKKEMITITDREWEAIQKGAISDTTLKSILDNTDVDAVKKRATPREDAKVNAARIALIKQMYNSVGNTKSQAEIAAQFGISSSMVSKIVSGAYDVA